MKAQAFATVCTARTQIEAGLLASILKQAGLHPLEVSTSGHISIGGAEIDYSLRVPTEELTEAREVLRAFNASST